MSWGDVENKPAGLFFGPRDPAWDGLEQTREGLGTKQPDLCLQEGFKLSGDLGGNIDQGR